MLSWLGKYMGFDGIHIHKLMEMPEIQGFLSDVMLYSVQPTLEFPDELGGRRGFKFEKYVESVLFRFKNWSLPDSIDRLDTKGTEKIRERIVSVIQKLEDQIDRAESPATVERLRNSIVPLAYIVAVWRRCVTQGVDELGNTVSTNSKKPKPSGGYEEEIKDPLADTWRERYPNLADPNQFKSFVSEKSIFASGMENMPRFERIFERWLKVLDTKKLSVILRESGGKDLHAALDTYSLDH